MSGSERKETVQGVAPLQKGGVRFPHRELAEVDDRSHPVLRIPRERIERIHLRQGLQAARPAVQLGLGVVCLAAGCVLLVALLWGGSGMAACSIWRWPAGSSALALAGAALTLTALRPGYYLEVRTAKGIEKGAARPGPGAGRDRNFPGGGAEPAGLRDFRPADPLFRAGTGNRGRRTVPTIQGCPPRPDPYI